jgi:uncharacterized protein (DUF433 family)
MDDVLTQHIQITPNVRGGKPCISGTRITVSDIAALHLRLGQSVDEIAAGYDLSLAAVHAALAYYYDHRDEIEAQMQADDDFAASFRRQNPSFLQAKLRRQSGG